MEAKEHFAEETAIEEEEEVLEALDPSVARHQRLAGKNSTAIDRFLGRTKRVYKAGNAPGYYGELLVWALARYLENNGWQVVDTLGYHRREPDYIDVDAGTGRKESLLTDGQLLVRKGEDRFIVTVEANLRLRNSILVEGPAAKKEQADFFVAGVMALMKEQNFYRGQKIEFSNRLRLLDLKGVSWDSVILDPDIRREIMANTVNFLAKTEVWSKLGIPPNRGIILAGEPGTGKTVICKALMAEARGLTCITTSAYALGCDCYIILLYELAQDLAPCLVFIEDIDLIGQDRGEFGYQKGPALLSLLAVLDGIEDRKEIVTIATTNCLETLDRALSQRPARFDRVIKLTRPGAEQRRELIDRLCRRIPLEESSRDYIAQRSEGYTPAQLQETVFSLAIEHGEPVSDDTPLSVGTDVIDRVMSRINRRDKSGLGFKICDNGHKPAPLLPLNEVKGKRGDLENS